PYGQADHSIRRTDCSDSGLQRTDACHQKRARLRALRNYRIQPLGARMTLSGKRILLVISGGIAAYKCLDLIRRLRERGAAVRCVMTAGAREFITPLSVGALSADHVFTDLFDRHDEHDVGHIRLSREADLVVVAPASADLMAKMAN